MGFDDTYRLITPADDRRGEVDEVLGLGFGDEPHIGDTAIAQASIPWRFTKAVEETASGRLRGVYGAFDMPTVVPGGARVPNQGLTIVSVHPGHRRRGILTRMIADHFEVAKGEGAIMSTLWAAEQAIYGRFGYGNVGETAEVNIGRGAKLADVAGSDALSVEIETLDPDVHPPLIAEVAAAMDRPGSAAMSDENLAWYTVEMEHARGGKEHRRVVVVRDGADVVGAATFRREQKWEGGVPGDTVHVMFHGALTPAAHHRLWSVLTTIDLSAKAETDLVTPDDPLMRLIGPHRGVVKHVYDGIWARLIDVKACMEARTYGADASVTIALTDEVLPENAGTWRLSTAAGAGGVMERVDLAESDADVALTIQQLSSAYFGGVTIRSMFDAGQVQERQPFAVLDLSRALRGDVLPGPNFHF